LGEALSGTPTAAPGTEAAGTTLDGATTEAVGAAGENEPESVSRGYVTELQAGAAAPRVKARRADDAEAPAA